VEQCEEMVGNLSPASRHASEIFADLIERSVREVTERSPEYFSHAAVDASLIEEIAEQHLQSSCSGQTNKLDEWREILRRRGVPIRPACVQSDDVSRLLTQCFADACAAADGAIDLRPSSPGPFTIASTLCAGFSVKTTRHGVCYVLSHGSGPVVAIISAVGMPLSIWFQLLADRAANRRYLIVQSRSGPLFEGGTPGKSSLMDDVSDFMDVINEERLDQVAIIAWCSGSRAAAELARAEPDRVSSLLFLAPTFYGAVDKIEYPSSFEDTLREIHRDLSVDPGRGRMLLHYLTDGANAVDTAMSKEDPREKASAVLQLPPLGIVQQLSLPMSSLEDLDNYMYRIGSDEQYDVMAAIDGLRCQVLLLTGTHDTFTNSGAARAVLANSRQSVIHATLMGAGHHIQYLQYPYFRYVLDSFLSGTKPMPTARLKVEVL
jgi:pimeloyl-ACP methyl ester carboxylesterase